MNDETKRYRRLVDLLVQRTRENKLQWEWQKNFNTCVTWINGKAISLKNDTNQNLEDLYSIQIINSTNGETVEYFSDEMLGGPLDFEYEFDNYFKAMEYLFTYIVKKQTGADIALDDILNQLESGKDLNEELPF